MGSNTSSHVVSIGEDSKSASQLNLHSSDKRRDNSAKKDRQRPKENVKEKNPTKSPPKSETEVIPFVCEAEVTNTQQIELLQKKLDEERQQLTELERQNLELQDYIEHLESQLEAIDRNNADQRPSTSDCNETLKVKDSVIEKLQKEQEKAKLEMGKLRIKFKKRLKNFNTKLVEEKNENSVRLMELRSEMQALKLENEALKVGVTCEKGAVPSSSSSGSQTFVILELSSKVSEQDARITHLENQLVEKNKELDKLQKIANRSKSNHAKDSADTTDPWLNEYQVKKSATFLETSLNLSGDSSDQVARQYRFTSSAATPKTSSRSCPGHEKNSSVNSDKQREFPSSKPAFEKSTGNDSSARAELQVIAEEMKQLTQKKTKKSNKTTTGAGTYPDAAANVTEITGLSGRDSGLSVDSKSNSPLAYGAHNVTNSRQSSASSRSFSVLSNNDNGTSSPVNPAQNATNSLNSETVVNRPPSGGIRYDADVSQCDTDLGLSDDSDNEAHGLSLDNNTRTLGSRKGSALRAKKRKGLLKSLMKNNESNKGETSPVGGSTESDYRKPPIYQVKPKDSTTLIARPEESLLMNSAHKRSPNLTVVS